MSNIIFYASNKDYKFTIKGRWSNTVTGFFPLKVCPNSPLRKICSQKIMYGIYRKSATLTPDQDQPQGLKSCFCIKKVKNVSKGSKNGPKWVKNRFLKAKKVFVKTKCPFCLKKLGEWAGWFFPP